MNEIWREYLSYPQSVPPDFLGHFTSWRVQCSNFA